MNSLLSIVVPVYKIKEEYLRKCIHSILDVNCSDILVILVDDGSKDDCEKICDEYAHLYECVKVIHMENNGVSVARNKGLELVDTQWVTYVDSDDWVDSSNLKKICDCLNNDAVDADIVLCDYYDEYVNGSVLQRMNSQTGFLNEKDLYSCRIAPFYKFIQNKKENSYSIAVVWNKIYKTSFLKNNDIKFLPDIHLGEDRIFNAEAIFKTNKIFYANETLYHYRWINSSVTNNYNPRITEYCLAELLNLKKVLVDNNKYDEIGPYFTCRICTRLYSCMRLYFFNKKNTQSYREKKKALSQFATTDLFENALKSVNTDLLSFQEKVFVFSLKHNLFFLSYLLVVVKNYFTKNKLG